MNRAYWAVAAVALVSLSVIAAVAQKAGAANPDPQEAAPHGYTLQTHVREVITDVTVTDRQGNAVSGLPESAFQIFDNGKPQRVVSFQEHTGADVPEAIEESPANVYNNDIALHPPAVFNVIVLDTATIAVVDQMYLRQELDRFIGGLPPSEPFAIFVRGGEHMIMLSNFTSDHQKLLKAMHNVLPRLPQPGSADVSDIPLMMEICTYLEQYPGRKNVLWFTGGSNSLLRPDPDSLNGYVNLRPVYDSLERARIALDPIDARGLVAGNLQGLAMQQLLMQDEATATGGQAIFNNNGLAQAARHIADTGGSFYTLTYSPQEVKLDNRWHKVKVELTAGKYQLSYRRGYYDDGSNLKQTNTPERKRLLKAGGTVPDLHSPPINFQVTVMPADTAAPLRPAVIRSSAKPPRRGERAYSLHYSVPVDAFPEKTNGDQNQFTLGLGVLAFNQYGRAASRIVDQITLGVSMERMEKAAPHSSLTFDQVVNLPDGQDFLYVAVWNMESGRVGVVQIPLEVQKARH